MVRYNTDETEFEVYHNSAWKPIRFREPTTIVQQNLGNGDGTETKFGPLNSGDSFYPVPITENNILVTIENVFQLATTNYTTRTKSKFRSGCTLCRRMVSCVWYSSSVR